MRGLWLHDESIAAMPAEIQDMIEYREWSIKNKTGIAKFMELKGKVSRPSVSPEISFSKASFPNMKN